MGKDISEIVNRGARIRDLLSQVTSLSDAELSVVKELLRAISKVSNRVAIVGGIPRDLIYSKLNPQLQLPKTRDLDVVFEGDYKLVVESLRELSESIPYKLSLKTHPQFLTAELKLQIGSSDEITIDVVRARRERYPHPGALPVVEPAPLEVDIYRRDFTVNTIMLLISEGGRINHVISHPDTIEDLMRGVLKPLHPKSFIDDPTRLMRGIRYAARFKFKLRYELEADELRDAMRRISRERFTEELRLILEERALKRALREFVKHKVLELWAGVSWEPTARELSALQGATRRAHRWARHWKVSYDKSAATMGCLKLLKFPFEELDSLNRGLTLTREERELLRLAQEVVLPITGAKFPEVLKMVFKSQAFKRDPLGSATILELALRLSDNPGSSFKLKKFLKRYLFTEPLLDGYTLRTLGAEGRVISAVLNELRYMQLLGKVRTRTSALKLARKLMDHLASEIQSYKCS